MATPNSIYSAKHSAKITWSRQSVYNSNKTSSKNDTKISKTEKMFHLMCQNSLASFYSQSDRFVTEHQKGTELFLVYMTEKKIPKLLNKINLASVKCVQNQHKWHVRDYSIHKNKPNPISSPEEAYCTFLGRKKSFLPLSLTTCLSKQSNQMQKQKEQTFETCKTDLNNFLGMSATHYNIVKSYLVILQILQEETV